MYGDQQIMKTITMTIVILTVLTLARGMIPRELARLLPRSMPLRRRSAKQKGKTKKKVAIYFEIYGVTRILVERNRILSWSMQFSVQKKLNFDTNCSTIFYRKFILCSVKDCDVERSMTIGSPIIITIIMTIK